MNRYFLYTPTTGSKIQYSSEYLHTSMMEAVHKNGSYTFFGGIVLEWEAAYPGQWWRTKAAAAAATYLSINGIPGRVWDAQGTIGVWLPLEQEYVKGLIGFVASVVGHDREAEARNSYWNSVAVSLIKAGWEIASAEECWDIGIGGVSLSPPNSQADLAAYQIEDQVWITDGADCQRIPAEEVAEGLRIRAESVEIPAEVKSRHDEWTARQDPGEGRLSAKMIRDAIGELSGSYPCIDGIRKTLGHPGPYTVEEVTASAEKIWITGEEWSNFAKTALDIWG